MTTAQPPTATTELTEAERIALVQRRKKKDRHLSIMLSIGGVLGFLLIWQLAITSGLVSSRYVAPPSDIVSLVISKLTDPDPDGSVLGVNVLSSLTVALTGLCGLFLKSYDRFRRYPGFP